MYFQDNVSPGGGGNRYMGNNICSLSPGHRHYSRNQIEQMYWVLLAKLYDICMYYVCVFMERAKLKFRMWFFQVVSAFQRERRPRCVATNLIYVTYTSTLITEAELDFPVDSFLVRII